MFNISTASPVCLKAHHKTHQVCLVKLHMVLSFVDYETLRTTGVILAVIMFVAGILIALSKFRFYLTYYLNTAAVLHLLQHLDLVTYLSFLKQVKNSQNV